MPDVYVPLDTTQTTPLHRELLAKSCINHTNLKYADKNRKRLKKAYKTFDDFNANYQVEDNMIDLLKEYADKAKIQYTDSTLNAALPLVKLQLKALLARDIWDMNEYYYIINQASDIFKAGVKAIKEE